MPVPPTSGPDTAHPPGRRWATALRRIEWALALALLTAAVVLHLVNLQHAGGLWRNEVQTVTLATLPSLGELWANLVHDSFPAAFHLSLRGWTALGLGTSDQGLRLFGAVIGLAALGAVWVSARCAGAPVPLLAIALIGLNTAVIRYGDGLRAYGMATLLLALTFAFVWRVVTTPRPRWVLLATMAATLSVQALYQNVVLVLAIVLAGVMVAARRAHWQRALLICGIGLVSALSLLVYLDTLRQKTAFSILLSPGQVSIHSIWKVFTATLGTGAVASWAWIALFVLALAMAVAVLLWPRGVSAVHKDRALFGLTTVATGTPAFLGFLYVLRIHTDAWHYLPYVGLLAVATESLVALAARSTAARVLRAAVVVLLAGLSIGPSWAALQIRQTNGDAIAATVQALAGEDDFILVYPWYFGATFQHYYRGTTPWSTLPPHDGLLLQRLDLFKEQMALPDPIGPVIERLRSTLADGHTVWVVGGLAPRRPWADVLPVPPAPHPRWGWDHDAYAVAWGSRATAVIERPGIRYEVLPPAVEGRVSLYEMMKLLKVTAVR